ncbi:uncharacterized protein LOC109600629 [Aethina tumida]|uniref:uncharacterized protein LOC109600629 n=1 Tax=Aethina tumida TaxID=116153 RepID=UPI00096B2CB9|nr:uncharacterized protein LOC109600629 [Aethina tumida]
MSSRMEEKVTNVVNYGLKNKGCRSNAGCEFDGVNSGSLMSICEVASLDLLVNTDSDINAKVKILESKCKEFARNNASLSQELLQQRTLINKLQSKVLFVKENQDVFTRVKEAYMNLKYNESTGRKLVLVHEKESQTNDDFSCNSCVQTVKIRNELNKKIQEFQGAQIIPRELIDKVTRLIEYIKGEAERRNKQYQLNERREWIFKKIVKNLENQNDDLKRLLQSKQESFHSSKQEEEILKQEVFTLKDIIIKLETEIRELSVRQSINSEYEAATHHLSRHGTKITPELIANNLRSYSRKSVRSRSKSRRKVFYEDANHAKQYTDNLVNNMVNSFDNRYHILYK